MVLLFNWILLVAVVVNAAWSLPSTVKENKWKQWNKWMSRSAIPQLVQDEPAAHFLAPHPHEPLHKPDEATMTAPEIIMKRGYPVEIHSVTTKDGYILELHRIPPPTSRGNASRVVFLQHGLLHSSAAWVINPTNRSLAFLLADKGYDVWLGNARGNTYSRKHISLKPSQPQYWKFSWDEMGVYDIPAVIEHILHKTNLSTLSYVGHSMGCAMFFVAMIKHPELNDKIDVMVALAPATSLANMKSPIQYATPFASIIEAILVLIQIRVFLSNDSLLPLLQRRFCDKNTHNAAFCRNVIFFFAGGDTQNFDLSTIPIINGHSPAGTSVHTVVQFAQNYNSGETFIPYDFGMWGNLIRYGQKKPPPYDLSRVTVPVHLFWGPNDLLVTVKDVEWLATKLSNVKSNIRVDDPLFSHLDFLWDAKINQLLYDQLISLLPPT